MSTEPWGAVVAPIAARCAQSGLDLAQPFSTAWYNAAVETAYRLPDFGRPHALGILIGNTRAFWPIFRAAFSGAPALRDDADPVDRYAADSVRAAVAGVTQRVAMRFAQEAPPHRVAMQRLAHVSGLASLSPSGLNIHPLYGPWIALRAAIVIDVDGPQTPPTEPPNPCPDCERTCVPLRTRAVTALIERGPDRIGLGETWPLWLAVRDACPVGREHRYGDDQIAYHYTKDRRLLRQGPPVDLLQ